MALIFSPSVRSTYAFQQFGNEFNLGTATKIAIYSGPQPTSSEFLANFGTKYHTAGANMLAEMLASQWIRGNNSWSIITFPAAVNPRLDGQATFAVLFPQGQALTNGSLGTNSLFVIVPVSDTSGDGVIRFTSTNFTTSTAVSIVDGGFSVL